MRSSLVSAVFLAVGLQMAAMAQVGWTPVASTGPAARQNHAMVYDSQRGLVVLFGGETGSYPNPLLGDTWVWNAVTWTQAATTGPGNRSGHAMAYDSQRDRTVLFGGYSGGTRLGDTWEWDGNSWAQVASTGPSPRMNHAMAYDSQRGRTVLFGGWDSGNTFYDTWEWDCVEKAQARRIEMT